MTPGDVPEPSVPKTELFREQALQAWRGQEAETRALTDLSPRWMRWAIAGVFLFAGIGVFLAASTSIPIRATSTASPRLSAAGDSVLVDAVFPLQGNASPRPGQTMSYRSRDPGSSPVDLAILDVVDYPEPGTSASPRTAQRRVLVRGALPVSRFAGNAQLITEPGTSGTVQILLGEESLLHLLRPRTPGGAKA